MRSTVEVHIDDDLSNESMGFYHITYNVTITLIITALCSRQQSKQASIPHIT